MFARLLRCLAAALYVLVHCNAASPGSIVAQSRFREGDEGWTVTADGEIYGVDTAMGRLKGRDSGAKVWYFVAPPKFSGDFMSTYDGLLTFSLGHYSYDSGGSSSPSNWDVIIGTGKFRIGVRDVVKPFNMHGSYEVALNLSTTWIVLNTMAPASNMDIVRVLRAISTLQIRGGFFSGAYENVWLANPSLIASRGSSSPSSILPKSAACSLGHLFNITLYSGELFGQYFSPPFSRHISIPHVPYICNDIVLRVYAHGNLAGVNRSVSVFDEQGTFLGKIFSGVSVLEGEFIDAVVIPSGLATAMTVDRTIKFRFAAENEEGGFTSSDSIRFNTLVVEFRIGGCFSRQPISWPNSLPNTPGPLGFIMSFPLDGAPAAANTVAFALTADGDLAPAINVVELVSGKTYSNLNIVGNFFNFGTLVNSVGNIMLTDSLSIPASKFNALRTNNSIGFYSNIGYPNTIQLKGATYIYSPVSCSLVSLTSGLGLNGESFYREVNSSFDFDFPIPSQGVAGDILIIVTASISNHDPQHYLRVRSREQSRHVTILFFLATMTIFTAASVFVILNLSGTPSVMFLTKITLVKIARNHTLIKLPYRGSWFLSTQKTVYFRSALSSMCRLASFFCNFPNVIFVSLIWSYSGFRKPSSGQSEVLVPLVCQGC
jgi:hypothetical protein